MKIRNKIPNKKTLGWNLASIHSPTDQAQLDRSLRAASAANPVCWLGATDVYFFVSARERGAASLYFGGEIDSGVTIVTP